MLKLILYAAYITIIIAIEIFIHIKKENDAISFLVYVIVQAISNFLTN